MQSDSRQSNTTNNQPTPQRRNQMNLSFLQKRKQQMKQQAQKRQKQQQRKRIQMQQRISKENKNISMGMGAHYKQYGLSQISTYEQQDQDGNQMYLLNNNDHHYFHKNHNNVRNQDKMMGNNYVEQNMGYKKVSQQDILKNGLIVKVVEICLNKNDYKIQCVYDGQMVEIIASKEEIMKNNIIPLLDFYERHLGLNQQKQKGGL